MKQIQTNCAYCGVGCGIQVQIGANGHSLKGDADHTANFGRLCQKGERLLETLPLPHALRYPRLTATDETISWLHATQLIADTFAEAIQQYGSDSVAFYLSGQLLTEDYYVANKLAKGYWGTANVDTNSRLCMSSAVSAHLRAFGEDVVPGCYQDFDVAKVIVLVGANTAWTHPVLFQRILRARESRGSKLVVIDPRRTATARQADLHIAIKPGKDLQLFSLLFRHLAVSDAVKQEYVNAHTSGLDNALTKLAGWLKDDGSVLKQCGVSEPVFAQLLALYRDNEEVVTASCMGVNQSLNGTDTTNAIINCHLLKGHIGKPGCGFFSLTGQPNAMGGREVGGLATQLANHMGFSEKEHRLLSEFWPASNVATRPGLSAVDLFQAMADGKIKAVWILATNPAASMPDVALVRKALQTCPFVVVSDISQDTDTAKLADLLLPAQGWSEKSGTTTNSERTITRQRPFLNAAGEARADWQMVCDVATAMGYPGFHYRNEAEIFREFAALSAKVVSEFPGKQLDLSGFADITEAEYASMQPQQWPVNGYTDNRRLYADGVFSTEDGRASFVVPKVVVQAVSSDDLILLSGRSRDQWHTRSRTGHVAALTSHEPQPCVLAHSQTLTDRQIVAGQLVRISNSNGQQLIVQALADDDLQPDQLFMSIHWTGRETANASVNLLLDSRRDLCSKQPAFKGQCVKLSPINDLMQGIAWGESIDNLPYDYRFEQRLPQASCYHFAVAKTQLTGLANGLSWQVQQVDVHCQLKAGKIVSIHLVSSLRIAIDKEAVSRLIGLSINANTITQLEQLVKAGDSPLVCVCKGVTREQVITVGHSFAPASRLEGIQQLTGCGTGCGSCRGELLSILEAEFPKTSETQAVSTGEASHGN
ncbi:molybdopterin-dependent oxidoreductase [Shewanella sp. A32]|uniref:nitrate reductase n=1 Tax=Shewanella sp. A32 TaxID=3031327 RepID=UPI0023B8B818|nr:molybdopterin-dependent oxidoreductase [Shewanella sp. A32]MDF0534312.1 molybdopterin-dependent oxidoreductase [Shewanella sp. A32]